MGAHACFCHFQHRRIALSTEDAGGKYMTVISLPYCFPINSDDLPEHLNLQPPIRLY